MKILILAGGFAKRMGEIAEKTPKALLEIGGKPVIEHILEKIATLDNVDEVFVSTNKKFEESFREWIGASNQGLNIDLVVEPVLDEGKKLGSIGALQYFIEKKHIDEDLFIINGDNIFRFDLSKLIKFYNEKRTFVFGVYNTRNINEAKKMGVVLSDQNGVVMDFEEKPENPKSTTVSTGIYMFPKALLPLIKQYLDEGNSPDRMGDLLIWLMKKQALHAFVFNEQWYDIGTEETYRLADKEFSNG